MGKQAITEAEVVENIPVLNEKQQALLLLKENGLSVPEAAKVLGYNKDYAYHTAKKISKYKLDNPKLAKSAHNVVKNVLEGKPWGAIDKIKDSTALTAAQMVYDRIDPVKRADQGNITYNFTQINLDVSNKNDEV